MTSDTLKRPPMAEPDAVLDGIDARDKQRALEEQERKIAREVAVQAAAWKAKWPSYCKACDGKGEFTYGQSHPYGSTTATETLADPCDCVLDGQCPRCGAANVLNAETLEGPCPACNWNYDDSCPEC